MSAPATDAADTASESDSEALASIVQWHASASAAGQELSISEIARRLGELAGSDKPVGREKTYRLLDKLALAGGPVLSDRAAETVRRTAADTAPMPRLVPVPDAPDSATRPDGDQRPDTGQPPSPDSATGQTSRTARPDSATGQPDTRTVRKTGSDSRTTGQQPVSGQSRKARRPDRPAGQTTRTSEPDSGQRQRVRGNGGYYIGAVVGMGWSGQTSWEFVHKAMPDVSLAVILPIFALVEIMLLACAWDMRCAARDGRRVASSTTGLLWSLMGVAAWMALDVGGAAMGPVRLAGPLLATVALHKALGVEMRHATGTESVGARLAGEIREWALSWVGIGDEDRPAVERRRERAERRQASQRRRAELQVVKHASRGKDTRRFRRAVLAAKLGTDEDAGQRVENELAAYHRRRELLRQASGA